MQKENSDSVEALSYLLKGELQRLKPSLPDLPKMAIQDLAVLTHFINPKTNIGRARQTIKSFIHHLAENNIKLTTSQFIEIIRHYTHAEDVPVYAELFDRFSKKS